MIGSQSRRVLRVCAALGMVAGLVAASFMPSDARAQGYYRDYGRPDGYGRAYPYGGYAPQYGAVYGYDPGSYGAPQAYLEAPQVIYVQPRMRYAAPVRRIVHRAPIHRAVAAKAPCSCTLPQAAKPVALTRPPAPAMPAPVAPPLRAAAPAPTVQTPPADLYAPRPSAGD
jgi:hypothetical protein